MKRLTAITTALVLSLAGCGGSTHHQQKYHTKYGVQAHSPAFGVPSKKLELTIHKPAANVRTELMLDTVNTSTLSGLPTHVLAGYTAGYWPTYFALIHSYPRSLVKSIAINKAYRAFCLDVEPGDATVNDVVPWIYADIAAGYKRPCIYSSISYWQYQIDPVLARDHIKRSQFFAWDANWTYVSHLDGGFDATQWTDHYQNRNVDASIVTYYFAGEHIKHHKKPPHHDKFAIFPKSYFYFHNGHVKIREYYTIKTWYANNCTLRSKRPTCIYTHYHAQLLEGRIWFVAHHTVDLKHTVHKPRWSTNHLGLRYQAFAQITK